MQDQKLSALVALGAAILLLAQPSLLWGQFLPLGTATPSELCGACHQEIHREFATGFGSDLQYPPMIYWSVTNGVLGLPATISGRATAHAYAGVDPWPIQARTIENNGQSCNVCHYPVAFAIPDIQLASIPKPVPRGTNEESVGVTCASCHLTPDGNIRAVHAVDPQIALDHHLVQESALQTSAACAYCHSAGARVVGKQTQTFLEWREDFDKPGLGSQQCQDCHMPRTVRKTAEPFDVPARSIARHLWTGAHSLQRLTGTLNLTVVQATNGSGFDFHIVNVGAGHSVPTGSNRRGMYLRAEIIDSSGTVLTNREWLFAPWYGDRPDDRSFLAADASRPDAIAATQADAQGPHETIIRAGEDRVLTWAPRINATAYTVRARLVHDLNRYNDPTFTDDQAEIAQAYFAVGSVALNIASSASKVTVSWPSGASGFVLEAADTLGPTATWRPVPGVANNSAVLDNPSGRRFYRLRNPN